MVALAWVVLGWPGLSRGILGLDRRLRVAALLAILGLGIYVVRVPVEVGIRQDSKARAASPTVLVFRVLALVLVPVSKVLGVVRGSKERTPLA